MIPVWVKWVYTLVACVVVAVYWHELGPANFLWFSDIALIALVPALWLENRLIASTMAVGVLALELAWLLDLLSGGNLLQIANYMFTPEDRHIDLLSGIFHIALILTLPYMLIRLGYDRRALPAQILLALVVLPASYLAAGPEKNLNWVYGPAGQQDALPPLVYLALLALVFVFAVYLPSHWLFRRLFGTGR